MKPAKFEYQQAGSIEHAVSILSKYGSDATVLAGGQSLMPMMNLRMARPAVLLDINRIDGLNKIAVSDAGLTIGSRARHNEVLRSADVAALTPLISVTMPFVAHEAIRNRGTLGGSLALADPSAEMPACAVCLGATIKAVSERGVREIPADDFFDGLYSTTLDPDELILEICYPRFEAGWRFAFDEISRRHGDFAIAALALGTKISDDRIVEARVVFSGVESHPRRLMEVERKLADLRFDDALRDEVVRGLLEGVLEPLEDSQYLPAYRMQLARTLLGDLLGRVATEQP